MKPDDKRSLNMWLVAGGCLGCGGLVVFVALFGFGFAFRSAAAPMIPAPPPPVPVVPPVVAPQVPPPSPASSAIAWTPYVHTGSCPNNANLQLAHFRVAYPRSFTVLPCADQEPRPWSYVTFHIEADGDVDRQVTLGYARGAPTQSMLQDAATQLVQQLGAAAPRLLSAAPLEARGGGLMRRDLAFVVPSQSGAFAPGSYVMRQVVVLGPGLGHEGLMVTLILRVTTTESDAIAASDALLLGTVTSVEF